MTTYRRKNSANRGAGFTLIEILVVIAIIGLLAGMTTTVLVSARQSARSSVVAAQMSQLSMALDDYKNKYGEYPPDFSDREAVTRHIQKRWPRYQLRSGYSDLYAQFLDDVALGCRLSSSIDPVAYVGSGDTLNPGEPDLAGQHVWRVADVPHLSALIFWLGGLPDADGKPSGFYANPKAPLGVGISRISKAMREDPIFSFDLKNVGAYLPDDPTNLNYCYLAEDEETWNGSEFEYAPAFVQGDLPVVYFRPSSGVPYQDKSFVLSETSDGSFITRAVPYARSWEVVDAASVYSWFEDKRFQLVHPGVDGAFGPDESVTSRAGTVPTLSVPDGEETYLFSEDADNVVNFAVGGVLETEYAE